MILCLDKYQADICTVDPPVNVFYDCQLTFTEDFDKPTHRKMKSEFESRVNAPSFSVLFTGTFDPHSYPRMFEIIKDCILSPVVIQNSENCSPVRIAAQVLGASKNTGSLLWQAFCHVKHAKHFLTEVLEAASSYRTGLVLVNAAQRIPDGVEVDYHLVNERREKLENLFIKYAKDHQQAKITNIKDSLEKIILPKYDTNDGFDQKIARAIKSQIRRLELNQEDLETHGSTSSEKEGNF
ncbi:hypothetical protein RF11_07007 [Thelohanellus kitauei]|uniref:Uncharacterized protein n=1 Tax=Thelohanellus kitauei TaxID=669202 RepID=A0A0C2MM97_THEKT|nr:hypothetical protein RF11_07007 [Thelohanellus kitauei]